MLCKATRLGIFQHRRIRKGETIDYNVKDGEKLPKWLVAVEGQAAEAKTAGKAKSAPAPTPLAKPAPVDNGRKADSLEI
jgi:hypothetical protein